MHIEGAEGLAIKHQEEPQLIPMVPLHFLGVASFRLLTFGVVFVEYLDLWRNRSIALDRTSASGFLIAVLLASVPAALGSRLAAIVVTVSLRLVEPHLWAWYDIDWLLQLFTLLLCFAPAKSQRAAPEFSALVILVLGTVYLDSTISKLSQQIWRNGSVTWLALTTPYVGGYSVPGILDHRLVFTAATYGILIYEAAFPLAIFRRFRRPLASAGLVLHLSIAVLLPLRWFGIVMFAPLLYLTTTGKEGPIRDRPGVRAAIIYGCAVAVAFATMLLMHHRPSWIGTIVGVHGTGYFPDTIFTTSGDIARLERQTATGWEPLPSFAADGTATVSNRWWKILGWRQRWAQDPIAFLGRYAARFCNDCTIRVSFKRATSIARYDPEAMKAAWSEPWHLGGYFQIADREPRWRTADAW